LPTLKFINVKSFPVSGHEFSFKCSSSKKVHSSITKQQLALIFEVSVFDVVYQPKRKQEVTMLDEVKGQRAWPYCS